MPFLDRGRDFGHVFVAFAEEDVVANADGLGEERDHVRGLAHGFAVGDLRFAFVEFLKLQARATPMRWRS